MRVDLQYPSVEQASVEAPDHNRALLLAKLILVGVATLVAGEVSWRLTGAQPIRSDLLTFSQLRRASQNAPNAVVLIGSSRVLCDLDPRILKRNLPSRNFYQLAIPGTSALPMLEAIAHDDTFCGQILCEFHISYVLDEFPFPETEEINETGRQYVRFIHQRPYLDFISTWFFETLAQRSALVADQEKDFPLRLDRALKDGLRFIVRNRGGPPSSEPHALLPAIVHREDRFTALHFRSAGKLHIASWAEAMSQRGRHLANGNRGMQRIASWVEAIRRHGGDAVFIRMPVTGSLKRIEDSIYPALDRTIQALAATKITVIDFAKEPALSGFDCPDESHMDADDAERFSAALIRILEDRQLLKHTTPGIRIRE